MEKWVVALLAMSAYLVFAFIVGVLAGRGRSFWSVSEYTVADRGLGLVLMWFLMGGTVFSAFAFLGGPGWAYSKGAASFYILAYTCLGLLPWYLIGPKVARIGARKNFYTMGEFLGDRYDSRAIQVLVGIISVLAFIQYLTLQIKGMAYVFNVLTEDAIPIWLGALISYGIVIVYVATSGVRGAAWSDVLQGILMLLVAWVVGYTVVYSFHDGVADMFRGIEASRPGFLTVGAEGSGMSPMSYTTILLVSVIGFIMWPHLFTKSFTTTEKKIKQTVLVYPLFAIFLVPILFIGFAAVGVVDPAQLSGPDTILPHLVTHEMGASGLVYGLIGAGALAAAMSSADAITHGGSVSFGRDIIQPLKPDLPERTQIWIMRLSVVAIGTVAYYLSIFGAAGLVQLLVGAYGSIVQFAPAVYGALWWRRGTSAGVVAGLVSGIAVNYYFQLVQPATPLDINAGILGLIVNVVLFVVVSMATSPATSRAEEYVEA